MFFLGRGNPERHCEHVGPGRGGEEGGDHPFLLREVEQGSIQPAGPRLSEGWIFFFLCQFLSVVNPDAIFFFAPYDLKCTASPSCDRIVIYWKPVRHLQ